MKKLNMTRVFFGVLVVGALVVTTSFVIMSRGGPAPVPMKETLYEGVTYRRIVKYFPNAMVVHLIVIDTKQSKGINFLITPADSKSETPLSARTTSQFLDEFDLQIAVNGDGFSPWWSRSPVDYYPHAGDPVAPLGFTASSGDDYYQGSELDQGERPTLYISRRNALNFNDKPNRVYNAISGDRMIVQEGKPVPDLDDSELDPRTAIGLNKNGRYLYLIVVDGRQPFYSKGITFADLAQLLVDHEVTVAMTLDGGGSSTLVIEGENGQPVVMNSPIDNYIPGRERPVGNHFGVYINP